MMRDAVIFDMGNVLIDWNPQAVYQPHFANKQEQLMFFAGLFPRMHHTAHDARGSFTDALAPLKCQEPEMVHLIEVFEHRWHEFVRGPLTETVEVLHELVDAGVPLYGLTNWPHQTWPPRPPADAPQAYDFLGHFADIVVSGQVQMHKPNDDIYDHALKQFGLLPEQAVFVDDLSENIATADRLGLHGIRFTNAKALRDELEGLGLLQSR
ncbi:alpha-D-glucose 1-phosphate phosphatase YihX [Rhodobiaceae bacterium]|nr:alpha-D-glucose 1-phosphate phosphatase YihX [Rhodobiaceae bacterium]